MQTTFKVGDRAMGFSEIPVGAMFVHGDDRERPERPYTKVSASRAETDRGGWDHPSFFTNAKEYYIVTAPPTIALDKTYRTRNGHEVRPLMVDGGGDEPVVGAFKDDDAWIATSWNADGAYIAGTENPQDLIEVKPQITRWVNVYLGGGHTGTMVYALKSTREEADADADNLNRIACLQITFTEGEGLA